MVLSEGFSSGNTTCLAFFQSTYSLESWVAQNSLSSSSLLNLGIFLFMGLIHPPFLAVHLSCRYHPYLVPTDGKYNKERPAPIRLPKGIETIFLLRMFYIIRNHQRAVEEYLLALRRCDAVLLPVLLGVVCVPLKPGAFMKKVENIHASLVYASHIQKSMPETKSSSS